MGNTTTRTSSSLPTVTVGIPAYNEEGNIEQLLSAVQAQKQTGFQFASIVVVNDASTDETASKVSTFSRTHPVVRLVNGLTREGKSQRLDILFQLTDADLLVLMDADITLSDARVLSRLVRLFKNPMVGIASGSLRPLPSHRFIGSVAGVYEEFWSRVTKHVNRGQNIHNCVGPILALRKTFYQNVHIPVKLVAQDHYLYFQSRKLGFSFRWTPKTLAYFKTPETLIDYLRQGTRFAASRRDLEFSVGRTVHRYYQIPRSVKLQAYLLTLVAHPILLPLALALQLTQRVIAPFLTLTQNTALWPSVASTK